MDKELSAAETTDRWMLDIAGTRLAVTRAGRGIPIICLHAIGHGARDFSRLANDLGAGYQIIAIDWPGHGASPDEAVPPSAKRYADLLEAFTDTLDSSLGISSAYILGNSIGGTAAIRFAAARPDRVRGLILCNPGGLQPVNFIAKIICRRMAAFFARGARGDRRFPSQFRRYYSRSVLTGEAAIWRRDEIVASAFQIAPLLERAWAGFAVPDSDLRHLAPEVKCPVLFAWAKGDRYVAWSRSKRAALAFPNAKVRLFHGSHAAFLEDPIAFVDALRQQFIASSAGAGDAQPTRRRGAA